MSCQSKVCPKLSPSTGLNNNGTFSLRIASSGLLDYEDGNKRNVTFTVCKANINLQIYTSLQFLLLGCSEGIVFHSILNSPPYVKLPEVDLAICSGGGEYFVGFMYLYQTYSCVRIRRIYSA
jgi:hypothetical protein